ncbi:MAG: hypothetical protein OQK82_02950 [Candidatus Pacearchaeota archaeon]|nr:hypothetical protein [Candidatus Pacearchaeota archaeon]
MYEKAKTLTGVLIVSVGLYFFGNDLVNIANNLEKKITNSIITVNEKIENEICRHLTNDSNLINYKYFCK